MSFMTDEVRQQMNDYLEISGTTQRELAEAVGKHFMQINRALTGQDGKLTSTWDAMLKSTRLKLVLVPEDTDLNVTELVRKQALDTRGTDKRIKTVVSDHREE